VGEEGESDERRVAVDAPEPEQPRTCAPEAVRGSRTGTSTRRGRSRAGPPPPCKTTSPSRTSTPSRPRLRRRPNVSTTRPSPPFLPLGLLHVLIRRRRDAPPGSLLACVLASEPQNCRLAMGRSSWATHALVLTVVVR
jgi:hypothetical protein